MRQLTRRELLAFAAAAAATPLLARTTRAQERAAGASPLAPPARSLLESSPFVYICPLRADGHESTCHGEVWFAWLDGNVVVITAHDRWKARSLAAGLDRARVWVGDHGTWKTLTGRSDAFRSAPSFDARGRLVKDPETLARLLAAYEKKYPAEIGRWRERFEKGFASGERVLIAYAPLPA